MTRDECLTQLARLSGLPFAPASMATHVEGLLDLPLDRFVYAVGRATRECDVFPPAAQLRQFVDDAPRRLPQTPILETPLAAPVVIETPAGALWITHERRFTCATCDDTGWESWYCGGVSPKPWIDRNDACGILREHLSHEWVRPCACREHNPVLVAARERDAKYAAARVERGR